MQNIVGQSSILTKAVERHSTSAIVKMSSSGTHRCSLIHSKLCQHCVPAGFCSRRANVVKKNKTLHCFVRLLPLKVSHSCETRHSSPRLLTYTVEVEEFHDLYLIKVTVINRKAQQLAGALTPQKTEPLLCFFFNLHPIYLSSVFI